MPFSCQAAMAGSRTKAVSRGKQRFISRGFQMLEPNIRSRSREAYSRCGVRMANDSTTWTRERASSRLISGQRMIPCRWVHGILLCPDISRDEALSRVHVVESFAILTPHRLYASRERDLIFGSSIWKPREINLCLPRLTALVREPAIAAWHENGITQSIDPVQQEDRLSFTC